MTDSERALAIAPSSSTIWLASSRVGASTSARRALRPAGAAAGLERLDERDPERERLARAGRRFGEYVVALQRVGDDELLDGERALYVAGAQRAGHGLGHAEVGEGGLLHLVLLLAARAERAGAMWWGEIRLSPTARCAFRSKNLRARRRRTRRAL